MVDRLKEYWCPISGAGPYPNTRKLKWHTYGKHGL